MPTREFEPVPCATPQSIVPSTIQPRSTWQTQNVLLCAGFGDTGTAGAHGREEAETAHDLMERVSLVLLALLPLHKPRLRHQRITRMHKPSKSGVWGMHFHTEKHAKKEKGGKRERERARPITREETGQEESDKGGLSTSPAEALTLTHHHVRKRVSLHKYTSTSL